MYEHIQAASVGKLIFISSCITFSLYYISLLFTFFSYWCWCWVNDKQDTSKNPNPIIKYLQKKLFNREWRGICNGYIWNYYGDNSKSDGLGIELLLFIPMALACLPTILYLSITFYTIVISMGILVLLAYTTRFGRRQKKLFDLHISDTKAHTKEKEETK